MERAAKIRLRAQDRNGVAFERDCDEMLAVCVQHEMDHLDGKLFVDYLSDLKRERIRKKLDKERKEKASRATPSAPTARARTESHWCPACASPSPARRSSRCPRCRRCCDSRTRVVGVLTQPDRPKGRGRKLAASPVKQAALAAGLPVSAAR